MIKYFSFFLLLGLHVAHAQTELVLPSHKQLTYEGRVNHVNDSASVFYWAGSSVQFHFEGTSVGVWLDDEQGRNSFVAIVDGRETFPIVIHATEGKAFYPLVARLRKGTHHIKLIKRTEPWEGSTAVCGFQIEGQLLPKPMLPALKIEYFGNSITSGMGNEDIGLTGEANGDPKLKNHYLSYASITSRLLGAEHRAISLSGIGITISWDDYIMPEIYNRLNPFDSASAWDFEQWQPNVVVVNLFQNDSWLVNKPDHEQFIKRFGSTKPSEDQLIQAYVGFVTSLRKVYPNASIICALGSMDATKEGSVWPNIVQRAVEKMQAGGDKQLYSLVFPYGDQGAHPTVFHDYEMAEQLATFIRSKGLDKK